jgi:hypothetical protein
VFTASIIRAMSIVISHEQTLVELVLVFHLFNRDAHRFNNTDSKKKFTESIEQSPY